MSKQSNLSCEQLEAEAKIRAARIGTAEDDDANAASPRDSSTTSH